MKYHSCIPSTSTVRNKALQSIGLIAQDPTKWHFGLFSKSISVIPTKIGRDIAWCKGHLVREYDLKLPFKTLGNSGHLKGKNIAILHFF